MTTRYLTVVFAITDEDAFKEQKDNLHAKMLVSKTDPWSVSAMSLCDEMTKLELIEAAIANATDMYELREMTDDIISKSYQPEEPK